MRVSMLARGWFWGVVLLLLIFAPVAVLLAGHTPPGRDFWIDFSAALGFVGLQLMGIQFGLTARFRRITAPFGQDIILHFHRQISLGATVLILAHPLLLFWRDPEQYLGLLNVFEAPWRARFAIIATLALLALIVTSIFRQQLKIAYEHWRISHGLLGSAAVVFGLAHIIGVNYYTGTTWKSLFWIAMSAFWISLLFYTRFYKPLWMLKRPWKVVERRAERGDCHTLVLEPDGHAGLRFAPGQFAWITLDRSPFTMREHPFSFSSSAVEAQESGRISFTIKELGDFTRTISKVEPGTRAFLDGPFGMFSADRHAGKGLVFIAGGIGITPVLSMLRTLADRGDQRPMILIYANKTWDDIPLREEVIELESRLDLSVVHVLSDADDDWQGETGYVDDELLQRHLLPAEESSDWQFFICGPDPMMDATEESLASHGVPLWRIQSERYSMV